MNTPAILQQINSSAMPNLAPIKQMMQMVRGAQNPQAMLQTLAQQNPQLQQVMTVVQQAGGDPQRAFYALAQQKGIDPNTILNALK